MDKNDVIALNIWQFLTFFFFIKNNLLEAIVLFCVGYCMVVEGADKCLVLQVNVCLPVNVLSLCLTSPCTPEKFTRFNLLC